MAVIYIYNNINCHYEIIINVIEKYDIIIKSNKSSYDQIFLYCNHNTSFLEYIKIKYPNIILGTPSKYDYYINCTIYPDDKIENLYNHYYICHRTFNTSNNNIFFITPLHKHSLLCDTLPFINEKKNNSIPIYVIQGNITNSRRNYTLLKLILEKNYVYDFKIKIVGNGRLSNEFNKYSDKLILKYNLNFIDFHKEFLDCYAIIPLILKKTHPHYYTNTLTTSIMYGMAYNLHFLIDKDLQDIYNLKNVTIFNDESDVVASFEKSLYNFYKM